MATFTHATTLTASSRFLFENSSAGQHILRLSQN